jgi:hypothetical protein
MEATVVQRSSLQAGLPVLLLILSSGCQGSSENPLALAQAAADRRFYDMLTHGAIAHPDLAFTLHAREVRGWKLTDVVLKKKDAAGGVDWVACARDGEVAIHAEEKKLVVHLRQGNTLSRDGSRAWFEDREVEMPLPAHFFE